MLQCGNVARERCDRVRYHQPLPCEPGKCGRNRMYGKRFTFKKPETWGDPDERIDLNDPYWGQLCLESWNKLYEKKGVDVAYNC